MPPDDEPTKWPCSCCGHRIHAEPPTGWTMEVCDICGWEDGENSYESVHNRFGNDLPLDDAQAFYEAHSVSSPAWLGSELLHTPTEAECRPAAWRMRIAERARLIGVIDDVFADVTLDGGCSLYDAELNDSYGYVGEWLTDEHRRVEARWQDITVDKLELFSNGGPCIFLDTAGLRFYLPAYMRHELDPSVSVEIGTFIFVLGHDDSRHRDLRAVLTPQQFQCVCAWLRTLAGEFTHYDNQGATEAWRLWEPDAAGD